MMDFRSFLRPYMITVYHIEQSEGRYEGGIWRPGELVRTAFQAAVVPFSDDQLQFGEAGTYTADDRRLFTYHRLDRGQQVEIDGEMYTVMEERDYARYAGGLRMYVVRRAGSASK
mgnify:CR=1 FL=1